MRNMKRDWAERYRQAVGRYLAALGSLLDLKREWDALDLGSAKDEDFADTQQTLPIPYDVTVQELTDSLASVQALDDEVKAKHAMHLYKVKI